MPGQEKKDMNRTAKRFSPETELELPATPPPRDEDNSDEREHFVEGNDSHEVELDLTEKAHGEIHPENLNTDRSTAAHMFISFVGAGVLGLPYAFMKVGLLGAILVLPFVGALATYAMAMLVACKITLQQNGKRVRGFGDIGFAVLGKKGSVVVDVLLVLTQVSFCCAYLLFIGENLHSVFPEVSNSLIVLLCIPGLSLLVLYRHIKNLSPFALLADVANIVGILVVMSYDVEIFREHEVHMDHPLEHLTYGIVFAQLPYFFGVSIYCYEGVGVILPIQESMANKDNFYSVLTLTMMVVTLVYMVFGLLGYVAYGAETKEIITLNLGMGLPTKIVKAALSVGLFFTYPLMMFPVFTIMESTSRLTDKTNCIKNVARVFLVWFSVFVALGIPNFGDFISLVGAGACSTLALILPAYFHLKLCSGATSKMQMSLNVVIIIIGSILAVAGTISAGSEIFQKLVH